MNAFRNRRLGGIGILGVTLVAAGTLAFYERPVVAHSANGSDALRERLDEMRRDLPSDLADGSVLQDVQFDGTRIVLRLSVDDRLSLGTLRDAARDQKCAAWRKVLRGGEADGVEFLYRQNDATSSLFIDRATCG